MDPMVMLDMERRTGFSHNDVDDFAQRMDMISEAMEQIKDGTFDPEKCKIPGFKTPEQEEKERLEKLRLDEERRQKEAEKQRKAKEDEKEQWWRRAKLRFAIERGEETEDEVEDGDAKAQADQWANRVLAAYKARDANDYSMWNNWVPEDPATLEEKAAREAALEKVRNAEFEKNNLDFCQQFKEDLEKRQQSQREREREAEKCKLQGNRFYKRRDYTQAIAQYMKSLDKSPFNAAVLTNIAQCYLRLEALDDSVEFSTRALYVNPNHVKALSRRAAVWHRQKKWKEAAQDMEKALQLDPQNEDVVEQHSIVVGDYDDALTQSTLEMKLGASTESASSETAKPVETTTGAEELRFIMELLQKMDDQERAVNDKKEKPSEQSERGILAEVKPDAVNEAWLGYELLVPFVERNADARDLLRTSGELHKLAYRLQTLLQTLPALIDKWTNVSNQGENTTAMMEEMATTAMLHVLAACLTESPRNQVVVYRETALRQALFETLTSNSLQRLPASIQEKLLRVFEEAIDAKAWKKDVIASDETISALLTITATPIDPNQATANVDARTKAVVSASSILFTVSGDDPHGLSALVKTEKPDCLVALSFALQAQRKSSAALSNLLGVLTNLSTHSVLRSSLDSASQDASVRSRLVRSLLILSSHFTKPSLNTAKRTAYTVCAERSLAALLNFSFQTDSLVRKELLAHNVMETVQSILDSITASNVSELMVICSRAVSLLCRLHSIPQVENDSPSLSSRLSTSTLLDQLYKLCQLSLPLVSASPSMDLWQTHAQIWCHVGWCISTAEADQVRAYLRDKAAMPAMVETLSLVNSQKLYRRGSSEPPSGPERIVGNVFKVLIAMLPPSAADSPVDAKFWTRKRNLKVLVDALQDLPDGLARKNVAIFLAKLCQVYGEAVKPILRELRGLEMLLSVSKSLQATPGSSVKPKAVAF